MGRVGNFYGIEEILCRFSRWGVFWNFPGAIKKKTMWNFQGSWFLETSWYETNCNGRNKLQKMLE